MNDIKNQVIEKNKKCDIIKAKNRGKNDYLRRIGEYAKEYDNVLKSKEDHFKTIDEMSKTFPESMQDRARRKMKTMALQNGGITEIIEYLQNMSTTLPKGEQGSDIER